MYIYNTVVCKLKYSTVLKVLACGTYGDVTPEQRKTGNRKSIKYYCV